MSYITNRDLAHVPPRSSPLPLTDAALSTTRTIEHYIEIRPLPAECQPAWVVRHDGGTLVAIDPRATRAEVVTWVVDHLTDTEQNAYREAYGQPPVGQPLDDSWMADQPFPAVLPATLVMEMAESDRMAG